jgi:hypothetical protein
MPTREPAPDLARTPDTDAARHLGTVIRLADTLG